MNELAGAECEVARLKAIRDSAKMQAEEAFHKETLKLNKYIALRREKLAKYVLDYPERFIDPRTRKIPKGSYGLRQTSLLEFSAMLDTLEHVVEEDIEEAYDFSISLSESGIKKMLKNGRALPGVTLVKSDTPYISISPGDIKTAKKAGTQEATNANV